MSGEGPESIPTSADPRSRRPVKKRALTPVTEQAKHLDALFSKPDQEIRLPPAPGAVAKRALAAPPEIVTNVQGSSAGAGSGEFHVYKASRRREYDRLRAMDEELKQEKEQEAFERSKAEREARDEERTRKNREKREKKKQRGKKRPAAAKGPTAAAAAASAGASSTAPGAPQGKGNEDSRVGNGDKETDALVNVATASQPVGLVIHDDD
ncbi:PRKR-interacting protein 1-like protein [Colletotrichum sidae]|uniref:PRKR-interacting protein 1-like protein n=1 Tax=Colletotrichum sidae TaxID=1347389 RepID=A0A4R8T637_9PEZI|nr:PRKR-interacting protein 1-like protein [Colletotrichum sidae]